MQQYTEHIAAVKAIAWSPHQHGLLASGGGTADRDAQLIHKIFNKMSSYKERVEQLIDKSEYLLINFNC